MDQLLTQELVALVPISSAEIVRLQSGAVGDFSLDQAFGEPSLDRISPAGDGPDTCEHQRMHGRTHRHDGEELPLAPLA